MQSVAPPETCPCGGGAWSAGCALCGGTPKTAHVPRVRVTERNGKQRIYTLPQAKNLPRSLLREQVLKAFTLFETCPYVHTITLDLGKRADRV